MQIEHVVQDPGSKIRSLLQSSTESSLLLENVQGPLSIKLAQFSV